MREQTWQSFRSSGRRPGGRRRVVPAAAAVVVAMGVMTMGVLAPPAASAAPRPDAVQQGLSALVRSDGLPAALASVKDRAGRTRTYTAGVGNLATGSKVPEDGQVRIGSNTKVFTAVVVLQLVGEGRIGLDATVDTYLPGLVRGEGIDGRRITVRQLLQHTSGLPNYTAYLGDDVRYFEPRDLLDIALQHKADFAPGTKWEYSNTNYVLAGLIIQKVTGRPLAKEMERRVIQRIGLRHTYFPAPGDMTIREPHPQGYYRDAAGAPLRDITEMDPSWGWAAGQMISTNSDLNQFFTALLAGRLLPAAQLAQMRTTVPAPYFGSGARYGLGLVSKPLSCGGVYWGHGGSLPGYETRGGATDDGRAADAAVTMQPADEAAMKRVERLVDTALCR
ncbi:serine hydrolase domain-containing protein [Streptomyces hygroscopicus]|uniref:serine hydrolase domain-containing protein n=1 Tax=Streptomyces hygroscopicus TaxID=1912 RepID=UPI001FCB5A3E|nr:serine hydrolase domain-containing protein [Streptomyces hygroscopicus]BDH12959.1 serine hydrolase [Streptomyces hygroscopicus]